MKAIILAAGKGKRLQPYTKNIPKCLLTLDKETILEHQINHLKSSEIQEINVVVGFGSDRVEQFLSNYDSLGIKINTIYNPFWESTNSLFSLWAARAELDSDVVVLNGDDVFELNVEPIKNPVSGEPHRVRIDIPRGFEFTIAEMASGTVKTKGTIDLPNNNGTHSHMCELHWNNSGIIRD